MGRSTAPARVVGGAEAEFFRIALDALIVSAVLLTTYISHWFVPMRT